MTTFRKLPTTAPKTAAVTSQAVGDEDKNSDTVMKRAVWVDMHENWFLNDRAQLEDRQVHCDHQAAYKHAQYRHNQGFQ